MIETFFALLIQFGLGHDDYHVREAVNRVLEKSYYLRCSLPLFANDKDLEVRKRASLILARLPIRPSDGWDQKNYRDRTLVQCWMCHGSGIIRIDALGSDGNGHIKCPDCGGSGRLEKWMRDAMWSLPAKLGDPD